MGAFPLAAFGARETGNAEVYPIHDMETLKGRRTVAHGAHEHGPLVVLNRVTHLFHEVRQLPLGRFSHEAQATALSTVKIHVEGKLLATFGTMDDEIEIEDDYNDDAWADTDGPQEIVVPPSTGKLMTSKERLKTLVQMRSAGASFEDCSEALGYSTAASAQQAFARQMSGMVKTATTDHIDLQIARTEQMMMVMWNKAMKGDHGAWDRVLRAMDKIDAYYGLGTSQVAGPGVQINVGNGATQGGDATGVIVIQGSRDQRVNGLREMAASQGFVLPDDFGDEGTGQAVPIEATGNEAS